MARIALIDDDDYCRRLLALTARHFGHEVTLQAADGAQALDKLSTCNADIIITDCQMPILDGISLARQLRARGDTRPILMLSGLSDPAIIRSALAAGVTQYLTKPASEQSLRQSLTQLSPPAKEQAA